MPTHKHRCKWPGEDALMLAYHDEEWGVPVHNDRLHFEFMVLDAFQAGLSWKIVLHKRENFREAFDNFNPEKIARYTDSRINRLLTNEHIIRNRQKVNATVSNAKQFLRLQKEFGSFDHFIWQFTKGETIVNSRKTSAEIPSKSHESDLMSRALLHHGFKFVGSTICYAYMQAAGMVNDHLTDCFRYKELK